MEARLSGDALEALGYLVGFWAFIFSPRYRATVLAQWRDGRWLERGFLLLDGIIATAAGLILPLGLDWLVVKAG
jgi:hypothetical protein